MKIDWGRGRLGCGTLRVILSDLVGFSGFYHGFKVELRSQDSRNLTVSRLRIPLTGSVRIYIFDKWISSVFMIKNVQITLPFLDGPAPKFNLVGPSTRYYSHYHNYIIKF